MKSNPWKTPFGLAFIALTLVAFVAGLLSGGGDPALDNISLDEGANSYSVDENALINANIEPEPVYDEALPLSTPAPEPVPDAPPPAPEPPDNRSDSNLSTDPDTDPPA